LTNIKANLRQSPVMFAIKGLKSKHLTVLVRLI